MYSWSDMYTSGTVIVLWAVVGATTAACVIYLTPFKWLNIVEPGIKSIDPAAFQADLGANADAYMFIDVRPENMYADFHAQGAVSMPLDSLYNTWRALPKSGSQIVLIGNGNEGSGVGYHYLQHQGFFNIARIEGGIENWTLKGLPVEGADVP